MPYLRDGEEKPEAEGEGEQAHENFLQKREAEASGQHRAEEINGADPVGLGWGG